MPVDDDTIYDEPDDEHLLTDTRAFRKSQLRGNRKICHRMDQQDKKIEEHDKLFDGDRRKDPPTQGVLQDVANLKKRVKITDMLLTFTGLSALGALLSIWWKNLFKGG